MGRLAIRIANVALFVLCAYLTADVVNAVNGEVLIPGLLPPRPRAEAPTDAAPSDRRSWEDRRVILDRNLFGAQLAGDALPAQEPEEDLEKTKLPLRLLGTAAALDPALSSAAIEDLGKRQHEVVRVGDRLSGHGEVQVAAIERRRVVLQNGPRREELSLDEEELAKAVARRPPPRRAARRQRPTRRLANRLQELRERVEDQGGRNPASLFSEARILPKYENGEMVGIQLNSIKSGSLYEKFGFHDGDVITELNGIRIDNPAASAQILNELSQAEEFNFEKVGPGGQPERFTVPADEVARILGDL
jgi:type II secretion system protein C